MNPIISIIVPCYNQANYLPDTLQSVLDQEFQNWECIIVNDGSKDNSEEIAKEWTNKDNRFKYFFKTNSGVSDTRNFGIRQALGTYILPLDGDDRIHPHYIKEALDTFNLKSEVKLIYSNQILFGARSLKIKSPDYKYENMFLKNQIFCSAIFKRSDFLKTKGYNPNMADGLEDWDFWLTFLKENDIVVKLDGFYFYYRIKDVSRSTLIDKEKNERLLYQIFKNNMPLFLAHINPIRSHIEAVQYKKEVAWLKKQPEYRIGSAIYVPIKIIKKAFKRVFGKKK